MVSIALLAVGIVSLPVILDQPLIQKKLAVGLADWSGGNLSFDGAIALSYFPQLSLKAEHVFLRDIRQLPNIDKMRARSVTAKFRWWPLLLGNLDLGELSLEKPEIYLSGKQSAGRQDQNQAKNYRVRRIFKTIRNIPFTDISVRNGLLVVPNNGETGRELYKFSGILSREDDLGNFSGRVHVVLNDREVFVSGYSSVTKLSLGQNIFPLDLRLANPLFQARIAGKLKMSEGQNHSFQGIADIKGVKVSDFSRWVGLPLNGNKAFSQAGIAGNFQWQGQRIDFSETQLTFGEHKLDGKLSLAYGGKRPVLEGNLSFATLDLLTDEGNNILNNGFYSYRVAVANDNGVPQEKSLTDYLNIDLRLFAGKVLLGKTQIRSAVATLLVNEGNINFQLADAKAFGGRAYGQILVKAGLAAPVLRTRLTLKDIRPEKVTNLLTQAVLLEGRADIEMDLVSMGLDNKAFLQKLNGKVMVKSASPGYIGLDLKKIFNYAYRPGVAVVSQTGLKKKWQDIRSGKTSFDRLSAIFTLVNGQVISNRVHINENGYLLSVQGQANLITRRIKWLFDRKMVQTNFARTFWPVQQYGIAATRRVVTLVEGGLDSPVIRHRYVGINAARVGMKVFPPQPVISNSPVMIPIRMRNN